MAGKTAVQSEAWTRRKMSKVDCASWEDLAVVCEIDRGTLYRYFTQKQKPRVGVLPILAQSLEVTIAQLLVGLGL